MRRGLAALVVLLGLVAGCRGPAVVLELESDSLPDSLEERGSDCHRLAY